MITIPSDVSRGVVSRSIAALRKTPNRMLGYIENMSGYYCDGCDAVRPLFSAPATIALDVPRLGAVPFDPELAAACDRGVPLGDRNRPAVAAVGAIAEEISRLLEV